MIRWLCLIGWFMCWLVVAVRCLTWMKETWCDWMAALWSHDTWLYLRRRAVRPSQRRQSPVNYDCHLDVTLSTEHAPVTSRPFSRPPSRHPGSSPCPSTSAPTRTTLEAAEPRGCWADHRRRHRAVAHRTLHQLRHQGPPLMPTGRPRTDPRHIYRRCRHTPSTREQSQPVASVRRQYWWGRGRRGDEVPWTRRWPPPTNLLRSLRERRKLPQRRKQKFGTF